MLLQQENNCKNDLYWLDCSQGSIIGLSVFPMETVLKAKIFTGKKEFSIAFDKEKNLLIVKATEAPDKGKANKEIVKELQKRFLANAMIVSGLKSREKLIKIELPREQILQILGNTKN
jgi:uncharacterized protein (TIGR00251 family)